MTDKIEGLLKEVDGLQASSAKEAEALRVKYLGKKGIINDLMADFRNVPADQKKAVGMKLNELKNKAQEKINALKEAADTQDHVADDIDVPEAVLSAAKDAVLSDLDYWRSHTGAWSYVDGVETSRDVLSSVTVTEPVTRVVAVGTKERPKTMASGSFSWPTSGRITSTFGGRASPGGIGSTNHKGIDIAGSYGIPVYASDGGTVSYAGWMGGYGYLVEIDHGNGYVTRYGHNSSLTVSVGEHVYKGQQIARVGSTGNSTGNHCHFEIRYNGVARNPLNYLP